MNREFLENLGLESDAINQIMKEHGKTVNPLKNQVESLETEKTQLTEQVATHTEQLEKLKSSDNPDDLKQQIEQYKQTNKALEESHVAEKNELIKSFKVAELARNSNSLDEAWLTDKLSSLELKDGELVDAEKTLNTLKESHPQLFQAEKAKFVGAKPATPSGAQSQENLSLGQQMAQQRLNQQGTNQKDYWSTN